MIFRFLLLLFLFPGWLFGQKPRLFILNIGVSEYSNSSIQNLRFADDDAKDLAAAFEKQNRLWRIGSVKILINEQATRKNIRDELDNLARLVNVDDFLIFVFSGHGREDGLLPYNADPADVDATTLSKEDLFAKLNALGCGYLVFIDACHSGSFAKSSNLAVKAATGPIEPDIRPLIDALSAKDKPYMIFGSSASDQQSFEWEKNQNGYFAQTILDALDNKPVSENGIIYLPDQNGDDKINAHELDAYIKNAARINTLTLKNPQKVYSRLTLADEVSLFDVNKNTIKIEPKIDDDYDKDGISDKIDQCKDKPGKSNWDGCPDSDGDLVHDGIDNCPFQKGEITLNGCPPSDRDRDGVLDKDDNCPDQPGEELLKGCPLHNDWMNFVEGGIFPMGSVTGDLDEAPVHNVTVSSFYLSKYEVTVEQYLEFCNQTKSHYPVWLEAENPYNINTGNKDDYRNLGSALKNPKNPIVGITWFDAIEFCNWLSKKEGRKPCYEISPTEIKCDFSADGYRLPTEAEWEFAARGGVKSQGLKYAGGNDLGKVSWFATNSDGKTHPVGEKKPNELDLYDMSGNVWEWCWDWTAGYTAGKQTDPTGPPLGMYRVLRSCSWGTERDICYPTNRSYYKPSLTSSNIGFRLAQH